MDETNAATAASGGASARDARRRKILERGTDRLAFITGQTRSVAPSSYADITSAPPPPPPTPLPDQKQLLSPADPVTLSSDNETTILKSDIGSETKDASDMENRVDTFSTRRRYTQSAVPQTSATTEMMVTPGSERPSSHRDDATQNGTVLRTFHQVFTPIRISHCVTASENVRLLCAVVIALLAASSYRGSTLFGMLASILRYLGPLYVVLLTDIAIVTGMLLIYKIPDKDEDGKRTGRREFDLAKALEVGLMVYRTTKAVLMDCSVCVVLMIVILTV